MGKYDRWLDEIEAPQASGSEALQRELLHEVRRMRRKSSWSVTLKSLFTLFILCPAIAFLIVLVLAIVQGLMYRAEQQ